MRTLPSRKRPWKSAAAKKAARLHKPAGIKPSHAELLACPGNTNARFWYWIEGAGDWDCFVKITLRPEQKLAWSSGGTTDEGWSRHYLEFECDGYERMVKVSDCVESQDCDGRHALTWSGECSLEKLQSVPVEFGDEDPTVDRSILKPAWERQGSSQRDYAAEMAGY